MTRIDRGIIWGNIQDLHGVTEENQVRIVQVWTRNIPIRDYWCNNCITLIIQEKNKFAKSFLITLMYLCHCNTKFMQNI
jgi:hypothetical protein